MRRLRVLPEAEEELAKAAEWYEAKRLGLGVALVLQVQRAFRRDPGSSRGESVVAGRSAVSQARDAPRPDPTPTLPVRADAHREGAGARVRHQPPRPKLAAGNARRQGMRHPS